MSALDAQLSGAFRVTEAPAQWLTFTPFTTPPRRPERAYSERQAVLADWQVPQAAGRYVVSLVQTEDQLACLAMSVVLKTAGHDVNVQVYLASPGLLGAGVAERRYNPIRRLVQSLPGALAERLLPDAKGGHYNRWSLQIGVRDGDPVAAQLADWLKPAIAVAAVLLQRQIRVLE